MTKAFELEVIPKGQTGIVNIEDYAMSLDGLVKQVQLIQQVMDKVMKKDEHYGVIPGTQKPTLLKPGAEKLCLTFRLDPNYQIIREIREKDFIAYTVKCDLKHIATAQDIASGIGSCNSRETKYRYRSENTEQPIPKEYWDNRDSNILGGTQYRPRKKDGRWMIFEQIENDNPWDLDNTLVKMACKRALVAATLNATAASDIFTQDLEDMPMDVIKGETTPIQPEKKISEDPKTSQSSKGKKKQPKDGSMLKKYAGFMRKMAGLKDAIGEERYYKVLNGYGYNHSSDVTESRMAEVEKAMKDELKAMADESRSEGDSENGDEKSLTRRYFEGEMEKFEEALGKPAFYRILEVKFKVKEPGDVPEPEMKTVLKAMMEELDKKNE